MQLKNALKSKYTIVLLTIFMVGFLLSQTISYPSFKKINSFEISKFESGVMEGNASFQLENSNWFSYHGNDLVCEVFYLNKQIAIGQHQGEFRIPKNTFSTLPMSIKFYADSLDQYLKNFLLQDSVEFTINVHGKFLFGIQKSTVLKLKIGTKGLINSLVSSAMNEGGVNLDFIKLKEIKINKTIFDSRCKFNNKLPFDVTLKSMKFKIYSDQNLRTEIAQWNFEVGKIIKKNEIESIIGETEVKNAESALSGIIKVLNRKLDYFVTGIALIEVDNFEIQIPLKQHILLDPFSKQIKVINDNE